MSGFEHWRASKCGSGNPAIGKQTLRGRLRSAFRFWGLWQGLMIGASGLFSGLFSRLFRTKVWSEVLQICSESTTNLEALSPEISLLTVGLLVTFRNSCSENLIDFWNDSANPDRFSLYLHKRLPFLWCFDEEWENTLTRLNGSHSLEISQSTGKSCEASHFPW